MNIAQLLALVLLLAISCDIVHGNTHEGALESYSNPHDESLKDVRLFNMALERGLDINCLKGDGCDGSHQDEKNLAAFILSDTLLEESHDIAHSKLTEESQAIPLSDERALVEPSLSDLPATEAALKDESGKDFEVLPMQSRAKSYDAATLRGVSVMIDKDPNIAITEDDIDLSPYDAVDDSLEPSQDEDDYFVHSLYLYDFDDSIGNNSTTNSTYNDTSSGLDDLPIVKPKPVKPIPPPPPPPPHQPDVVYESRILPSVGSTFMRFGHHLAASDNILLSTSDLMGLEGSVHVYCKPLDASTEDWKFITKLQSPYVETGIFDGFGLTAAIDNGRILIGAKYDNSHGSSSGQVYSFPRLTSTDCDIGDSLSMNQAKSLFPLSQSASRGYFGDSIAISGEYAVISASGYSSPYIETGTVFLYNYHSINDSWVLIKQLFPSDPSEYANFGSSVSIYENIIAVGAKGDSMNESIGGAVYIYAITSSSDDEGEGGNGTSTHVVTQHSKLAPSVIYPHAYFGKNVYFTSDVGLVSAYERDGSGVVYVYEKIELPYTVIHYESMEAISSTKTYSLWMESARLTSSDSMSNIMDQFGKSMVLAVNNTIAAIGCPGDGSIGYQSGSVEMFGKLSTGWKSLGTIHGKNITANDGYGTSMALLNSTLYIGAELATGTVYRSGVVFIENHSIRYYNDIKNKQDTEESNGMNLFTRSTTSYVIALIATILPAIALTALITYRAIKLHSSNHNNTNNVSDPKKSILSTKFGGSALKYVYSAPNSKQVINNVQHTTNPIHKPSKRMKSRDQPFSLMLSQDDDGEFESGDVYVPSNMDMRMLEEGINEYDSSEANSSIIPSENHENIQEYGHDEGNKDDSIPIHISI